MAEFSRFGRLPAELRIDIWELTIPRQQRIVNLIYDAGQDRYFSFNSTVPTLLHVCSESRQIGLKEYKLCFGTKSHPASIPFCHSRDILLLDDWLSSLDFYPVQVGPMLNTELHGIQQVAINHGVSSISGRYRRRAILSAIESITSLFTNLRVLYLVIEQVNPYTKGTIRFLATKEEECFESCVVCYIKNQIQRATTGSWNAANQGPSIRVVAACRGEDRYSLAGCTKLAVEDDALESSPHVELRGEFDPSNEDSDSDSDSDDDDDDNMDDDDDDDNIGGDNAISEAEIEGLLADEREYEARHKIGEVLPQTLLLQDRQYCTQACLLGLKRGWDLDDKCPNVPSHCMGISNNSNHNRHRIQASELIPLVNELLKQNPRQHCIAVDPDGTNGKNGSVGTLFKLTLAPYGYTFVAKGVQLADRNRLEHESLVYSRLERLQGEVVPVFLGIANMSPSYVLPSGARIFYMTLMSWAGNPVCNEMDIPDHVTIKEKWRSREAVLREGVYHDWSIHSRGYGDDGGSSSLWNKEGGRVMLVNFDESRIFLAGQCGYTKAQLGIPLRSGGGLSVL